MTAPNWSTLWGKVVVEELVSAGIDGVCIAPGSRSTPLTLAFAKHEAVQVFSHLDERSAGFFALGRARRTGRPTAVVCTSGTATANLHPAVMEADRGRVPLVVLTADRPVELRDSGANQTTDQAKLYGDAVRWFASVPEPFADERTVRALRTIANRAIDVSVGTPAGPVHLNCPFRKPLEPTPVADSIPHSLADSNAVVGRNGPYVEVTRGKQQIESNGLEPIVTALETAERPLFVAGPADPPGVDPTPVVELATAVGGPMLADPLSDLRFGPHVSDSLVCGGYDAYVDVLPSPDVVVRVGAPPTSKRLRHLLRDADARQFLVDPAGDWREATFSATDLLVADPDRLFGRVRESLDESRARETTSGDWAALFEAAEAFHWSVNEDEKVSVSERATDGEETQFEGAILASVIERAPDPSTIFVSNSMPIRDADRFGRPRTASLSILGNRGVSGIDGITSSALGAGSGTTDPLVLVTGDLAMYHDSNGLLAVERCDVDATIVLLDNRGGGIFHMLPIEEYDPPFTEHFKTPHDVDFESIANGYGISYESVDLAEFDEAYTRSLETGGTDILSISIDAERSHRRRERLERRVIAGVRSIRDEIDE